MSDLERIEVQSGVNDEGLGFCSIFARSTENQIWAAQMTPAQVRGLALQWLEVAESAEQDAAILRLFRKLDLPDGAAGAVISELRDSRTNGGDSGEEEEEGTGEGEGG